MNKYINRLVPPYVFWPVLCLCAAVSMALVVVVMLVSGSDPFTVRNLGTQDLTGQPREQFHMGEVVVIRRQVCTSREVALGFYPGLRSAEGVLFALPSGATHFKEGCRETLYGFELPRNLLPGIYTYQNMVQYQTNWVGRDEQNVYPPLKFEVVANAR